MFDEGNRCLSRSLVQGLSTIATQTNVESEAHQAMANVLLNKISVPMKNLAETQTKGRKPVRENDESEPKQRSCGLDRRRAERQVQSVERST